MMKNFERVCKISLPNIQKLNLNGAEKRTRTSTVLPPLGPEPSASTNFAISALREGRQSNMNRAICQ